MDKQIRYMWYNRPNEYLIKEGYVNDHFYPCVFIKQSGSSIVIIEVYIVYLNLKRTLKELQKNNWLFEKWIWNEIFREN